MSDINTVVVMGRLARDPEIAYTSSGIPYCKFDLAVSKAVKQGDNWTEGTIFLNKLTLWRQQAETFHRYLRQGDQVVIEGSLDMDEWQDKESGQKRSRLTINVRNFRFGAKKGTGGSGYSGGQGGPSRSDSGGGQGGNYGGGGGGNYGGGSQGPSRQNQPSQSPPADYQPDNDFNDDDIPF